MHPPESQPRGHWSEIARRWQHVGSPLRQVAQDVAFSTKAVHDWAATHGAPRALILGVTQELYHLPWPAGTQLVAVDHTQAMIDALWPGPRSTAICADWTNLPLAANSRDVVLCDGGMVNLPYPAGQRRLVHELRRVVAPGGLCIFRLYVPPAERETPDSVLRDLLAGGIANLNILKLRLGMAMQESSAVGVQLAQVWETLHRAAPDFPQLAAQLGWPLEHLLTINTYRDSPTRYTFLSIAEVCQLFTEEPDGFAMTALDKPTYALGERCPTIVFRRTG